MSLEVFNKRVEPLVFGDDVEGGAGELSGKAAYVIGDVEVEGVGAGSLDADVFGVRAKGLEFGGEVERDFGLGGAAEDHGFIRACSKLSQVFGLNVLEVYEDEVRFQMAGDRFDADGTCSEAS